MMSGGIAGQCERASLRREPARRVSHSAACGHAVSGRLEVRSCDAGERQSWRPPDGRRPCHSGCRARPGSRERRRPATSAPLIPGREPSRCLINGLTASELTGRGDVEPGSPLGQFLVRHRPRCLGRFGLAPIESCSLLGWGDLEVAHLHRCPDVCRCLPQSRALISTPKTVINHNVVAELESTQSQLDQPSFDDVLGGRLQGPSPIRPSSNEALSARSPGAAQQSFSLCRGAPQ